MEKDLYAEAEKLRNGEESTLTLQDVEQLKREETHDLEINTSFLDVGIQPYINIEAKAEKLRKLLK